MPTRFPSVSAFMALSDELAVVDKFVCTRGDVTRALGMAVETVLNNAAITNPMTAMTAAQRLKAGQNYAATAAAGSRSGKTVSAKRQREIRALNRYLCSAYLNLQPFI